MAIIELTNNKNEITVTFSNSKCFNSFSKNIFVLYPRNCRFCSQSIRVLSITLSVSVSVSIWLNGLLIIVLKSHSDYGSRKFQIVKSLNAIFDDIINHLALISVAQPVCKSIQTKISAFEIVLNINITDRLHNCIHLWALCLSRTEPTNDRSFSQFNFTFSYVNLRNHSLCSIDTYTVSISEKCKCD